MEKATLGSCVLYKIWQILKRFAGTFRRAQTRKLPGRSDVHEKKFHKIFFEVVIF